MFKTPLSRLRLFGFLEGISFLVLLGIAMPLKYFLGIPEAVRIVGMAHGFLFVIYMLAVLQATFTYHWSLLKIGSAVLAAFVPFGNFILDAKLKRDQQELDQRENWKHSKLNTP